MFVYSEQTPARKIALREQYGMIVLATVAALPAYFLFEKGAPPDGVAIFKLLMPIAIIANLCLVILWIRELSSPPGKIMGDNLWIYSRAFFSGEIKETQVSLSEIAEIHLEATYVLRRLKLKGKVRLIRLELKNGSYLKRGPIFDVVLADGVDAVVKPLRDANIPVKDIW